MPDDEFDRFVENLARLDIRRITEGLAELRKDEKKGRLALTRERKKGGAGSSGAPARSIGRTVKPAKASLGFSKRCN